MGNKKSRKEKDVTEKRIQYGQVFTHDPIVDRMIDLIRNKGIILEPSAGNGAFYKKLYGGRRH